MEKKSENYSYLKKDLTKVFIISGSLVAVIIFLYFLNLKTNYVSQLAEKIMSILIKK